jgi:hypothetical protein
MASNEEIWNELRPAYEGIPAWDEVNPHFKKILSHLVNNRKNTEDAWLLIRELKAPRAIHWDAMSDTMRAFLEAFHKQARKSSANQ